MKEPLEKLRNKALLLRGKHIGLALLLAIASLGGYAIALSGSRSSSPPLASRFSPLRPAPSLRTGGTAHGASNAYTGVSRQSDQTTPPALPSEIVRTANVTIRVGPKKAQPGADRAAAVASAFGGYVVSSTFHRASRDVLLVLRVPSQHFYTVLKAMRRLGVVAAQDIRGEDVSLQFVDLGARLKNLEAQRAELLKLFTRANTVGDTIRVQNVLGDIQYQLEQTQARLRYLSNRTSLSTIRLDLQSRRRVIAAQHPSPIVKPFSQAIVASLTVISGSIVIAGYLFPFALLALAAYGVYLVSRRFHTRTAAPDRSMGQ